MKLSVLGITLVFTAIMIALLFLLWPKPTLEPALQNQVVAVSSAGASATSVVAGNAVKAEAVAAQVRKGTRDVQATTGAKDSMGDTGLAGIGALCSMSNYADDPACKLQQSGATGLEERGRPGSAPSG